MPDKDEQPVNEDVSAVIAKAQLEKLQLEIDDLKNKRKWDEKLLRYLPFLTTMVAVIGISLAAMGYFADREKERQATAKEREAKDEEQRIRDEGQIRINVDQLISLDPKQPVAKVPYILNDLAELIKRKPPEEQKTAERRVTEIIFQFISRDAELLTPRMTRTDKYAIEHWAGYQEHLKVNPEDNALILDNYIEAFVELHKKDPKYFSGIIDFKDDGYDIGKKRRADRTLFFLFTELVEAFSAHLKMPGVTSDNLQFYIAQFQDAIKNPTITKHFIEQRVFPYSEIEMNQQPSSKKPSVRSRG